MLRSVRATGARIPVATAAHGGAEGADIFIIHCVILLPLHGFSKWNSFHLAIKGFFLTCSSALMVPWIAMVQTRMDHVAVAVPRCLSIYRLAGMLIQLGSLEQLYCTYFF